MIPRLQRRQLHPSPRLDRLVRARRSDQSLGLTVL
jgi:hypothetical protein